MTNYDHAILQSYADALYDRARDIIAWYAVKYGFVGLLFSWPALTYILKANGNDTPAILFASLIALFCSLIGAESGRTKAFMLKLEAQKILCQMSIETNTRINARESLAAAVSM